MSRVAIQTIAAAARALTRSEAERLAHAVADIPADTWSGAFVAARQAAMSVGIPADAAADDAYDAAVAAGAGLRQPARCCAGVGAACAARAYAVAEHLHPIAFEVLTRPWRSVVDDA